MHDARQRQRRGEQRASAGRPTSRRPPRAVTRSLIPTSPGPLGSAPPIPLSCTSMDKLPSTTDTTTIADVARECFITLVSASAMTK